MSNDENYKQAFTKGFRDEFEKQASRKTGLRELTEEEYETLEKCASIFGGDGAQKSFSGDWEQPKDDKKSDDSFTGKFMGGIANNAASSLVSAGAGMALYGGSKALQWVSNNRQHHQFMQAVDKAIKTNDILEREAQTKSGKQKILSFAETVFNFAPSVAVDPNLLSTILANAIQYGNIDTATLEHLTNLENRHKELQKTDVRSFT